MVAISRIVQHNNIGGIPWEQYSLGAFNLGLVRVACREIQTIQPALIKPQSQIKVLERRQYGGAKKVANHSGHC
jgi:hypothetical protein